MLYPTSSVWPIVMPAAGVAAKRHSDARFQARQSIGSGAVGTEGQRRDARASGRNPRQWRDVD